MKVTKTEFEPSPSMMEILKRMASFKGDVAHPDVECIDSIAERYTTFSDAFADLRMLAEQGYVGSVPEFGGGWAYWITAKGRKAVNAAKRAARKAAKEKK